MPLVMCWRVWQQRVCRSRRFTKPNHGDTQTADRQMKPRACCDRAPCIAKHNAEQRISTESETTADCGTRIASRPLRVSTSAGQHELLCRDLCSAHRDGAPRQICQLWRVQPRWWAVSIGYLGDGHRPAATPLRRYRTAEAPRNRRALPLVMRDRVSASSEGLLATTLPAGRSPSG